MANEDDFEVASGTFLITVSLYDLDLVAGSEWSAFASEDEFDDEVELESNELPMWVEYTQFS